MKIDPELLTVVTKWLADDPDPATRRELEDLLERGQEVELRERFRDFLRFGTAGLRGLLGAGPNRMNRAVVGRATAGFLAYVRETVPNSTSRGLCVGFDGRHKSREFATDVAEIAAGAGFHVFVFEEPVPTPLLAYAVREHEAAGGVMVTASHNPAAYNGYKVYWENGAQILPPHDEGIAARIAAVESLDALPRLDATEATHRRLRTVISHDIEARYVEGVLRWLPHPEVERRLSIALTSLHGVGGPLARRTFAAAGFERIVEVSEQATPDPDFPTVDFPNPEEEGAMDRVLELAAREETDLALAHDPDADRLAVAVRHHDGRYVVLNGNELGALLGHYVLTQPSIASADPRRKLVLSTLVSSPLLGEIAKAVGAEHESTLTGFKWIANRAIARERTEGLAFVFGYEEALGYCVGTLVRDKDGIGAGALLADLAAFCKDQGRTLLDELDRIYRRYGLWLSRPVSLHLPGREGLERIGAIMRRAREHAPTELAGIPVLRTLDLLAGTIREATGQVNPLALPRAELVVFELEGGHRAMLRPSGTEPKLKYYIDACTPMQEEEPLDAARSRGEATLDALASALRLALE